jgi:hypothetical protein
MLDHDSATGGGAGIVQRGIDPGVLQDIADEGRREVRMFAGERAGRLMNQTLKRQDKSVEQGSNLSYNTL